MLKIKIIRKFVLFSYSSADILICVQSFSLRFTLISSARKVNRYEINSLTKNFSNAPICRTETNESVHVCHYNLRVMLLINWFLLCRRSDIMEKQLEALNIDDSFESDQKPSHNKIIRTFSFPSSNNPFFKASEESPKLDRHYSEQILYPDIYTRYYIFD